VITGEQDAGKLARPVREGADGKGLREQDLAGGLLHVMRGGWKRSRVLGLPSLQCTAWTAPDQSTTAPVSYSTFGLALPGCRAFPCTVPERSTGVSATSTLLSYPPDLLNFAQFEAPPR